MAAGIQHVQAAQFIEVSPPSTRSMAKLKDIKKRENSNFKCGTCFGGRSRIMAAFKEYSEFKEPHPLIHQEAPEQVAKDLLSIAESDPESVIRFAAKGIPAALNTISKIPKH